MSLGRKTGLYVIVADAKGKRRVETFQPRAKVLVKG